MTPRQEMLPRPLETTLLMLEGYTLETIPKTRFDAIFWEKKENEMNRNGKREGEVER